jgi:hypothetical protein
MLGSSVSHKARGHSRYASASTLLLVGLCGQIVKTNRASTCPMDVRLAMRKHDSTHPISSGAWTSKKCVTLPESPM